MGYKKGTGMSVKDKLQIILITYNRAKHVESTFKQILSETSPIRDFNILVLDNNSTDNTSDIVRHWQKQFSNLQYQKNNYNIGISGNIAKAMEIANQKYLWIIADDDKYDFSNWDEVEFAIENNEKVICVAKYAYGNRTDNELKCQIAQLVFIPAIIFNTEIFTDTVMRNVFDNIYTLMPHLCPIIDMVNKNEKFYILKKAIVENNMQAETDCSYTRGTVNENLFPKTRKMSWVLGYANILEGLNDRELADNCMLLSGSGIHQSLDKFYKDNYNAYQNNLNYLMDIILSLSPKYRGYFVKLIIKKFLKKSYKKPRYMFTFINDIVNGRKD